MLVDQFRHPDGGLLQGQQTPPENPADPPWATLKQLDSVLDPWLRREFVDTALSHKDQVAAILKLKGEHALAVRDGVLVGVIDVQRAGREILRQLVEGSAELTRGGAGAR